MAQLVKLETTSNMARTPDDGYVAMAYSEGVVQIIKKSDGTFTYLGTNFLAGNYIDVPAIDGYIIVPDFTIPVAVQVNNTVVDIDQGWMIHQGDVFKLAVPYILAAANLPSYTGIYRVWRAGGKQGPQGQQGPMGYIAFQGLTQQQIEQIRGPQGIQGQVGPQGQRGPTGYIAFQGLTQQQVEQIRGQTGPANTLTIGTVTTLDNGVAATAQITGQSPNQVLSLGLPKGDKGDKGDKGAKGDKGDPGTDTYVLCLCQQSPDALFDGMIWIKGGTNTPKYVTAVGGTKVLTTEPSDISKLSNGTFIITDTEQ